MDYMHRISLILNDFTQDAPLNHENTTNLYSMIRGVDSGVTKQTRCILGI